MEHLISLKDFEDHFKTIESQVKKYYVNDAAGLKITLGENERAFQRLRLLPSVMKDVSTVDMSTTILGQQVSMPIGIAPTACQGLYWHEGEQSTFRAVEKSGAYGVLSNLSTQPLEKIEESCPSGRKWLNTYLWEDREHVASTLRKAKECGFTAVVVTADGPVPTNCYDLRKHPIQYPANIRFPLLSKNIFNPAKQGDRARFNPSVTWKDIDWLRTVTDLPIVVKGILTPGDAVLAVEHGAAAILVSNHGGRQLDTVPATIEALPDIVDAVAGRVEVYMDGGIRMGTDVVKALAMGARAVFIGRPVVWGLAGWGTEGVLKVLQILKEELRTAMSFMGCSNLSEIDRSKVLKLDKSRV